MVRNALEQRLTSAVGLNIVGSTGKYELALRQACRFKPDIILLETKAPEGLATLQALHAALPNCAIIVLTSYPDSREEDEVVRMGAASYLLKTLDTKALVSEIRAVARRPTP
jgi:DNA-binding NarL/FixJ family response regulator